VLLWQIGPGLGDIARRQFERERGRYTRAARSVPAAWPCYVAMLVAALVLAVLLPWGWWVALAVLVLGVARQTRKSVSAYRKWGTRPQGSGIVIVPLLMGVHLMEVGTRTAGMMAGLVAAPGARRVWNKRREEYLARGPFTPSAELS
ncbi:MAG: hypothetical protein HQ559_10945, partial [Lentisphaerae bacterium]|nr:hypothetical protein [Lentisphaerota bacterium]